MQALDQYQIRFARIVTPSGIEPPEISIVWQSIDPPSCRHYQLQRGFLSKRNAWMEFHSTPTDAFWKFTTYFLSNDSKLCAYVAESIDLGHKADVIQVECMISNEPILAIVMAKNHLHGPIHIQGPNSHFKFSGEKSRRLLYFASPNVEQLHTKSGKQRKFVIGIYDFELQKTVVITDESICTDEINAIEWTPDAKGIVFHRGKDLWWHNFGQKYINQIYKNVPCPLKITFSPDEKRLAVLFPHSSFSDKDIVLFHWPFVRAASLFQHDVLSLDAYKVWSVPDRPWAFGGSQLIFNANAHNKIASYSLVIDDLSIQKFSFPRPATVIDVNENEMLFETIAANAHARLWISPLTKTGPDYTAHFLVGKRPDGDGGMFNFTVKPVFFDENQYSGVLYLMPTTNCPGPKMPLVVVPWCAEGVPNFTLLSVDPALTAFVNCGLCVLVVNYRKPFSTIPMISYPQHDLAEIVEDVHNAARQVLKDNPRIDENHVTLYGQGYGTYVVQQVLRRHAEFYKAAAFYQPVTDILMVPPEGEDLPVPSGPPQAVPVKPEITVPLMVVIDRREDQSAGQCEKLMVDRGQFLECFEEDDQEYNDFMLKIAGFLKSPKKSVKDRPPTPGAVGGPAGTPNPKGVSFADTIDEYRRMQEQN